MRRLALTLIVIVVVVPMYGLAGWLLYQSGALTTTGELSDAQLKTFLTFIGATLTASVTLIGLLLTDAHNERLRRQSALDTAVKGIALMTDPGHEYATKASVGGALAALVHLEHPVIAMRSLDAAWDDDAVHASTASWLIGEVIKERADNQSVLEAAEVLRNNADKLVGPSDKPGLLYWPQPLLHEWPGKIPMAARMDVLVAVTRVLLTRNQDWWKDDNGHFLLLLHGALRDGDPVIRYTAAAIVQLIAVPVDRSTPLTDAMGTQLDLDEILDRAWEVKGGTVAGEIANVWGDLWSWVKGTFPPPAERTQHRSGTHEGPDQRA